MALHRVQNYIMQWSHVSIILIFNYFHTDAGNDRSYKSLSNFAFFPRSAEFLPLVQALGTRPHQVYYVVSCHVEIRYYYILFSTWR